MKCPRCLNEDPSWFAQGSKGWYCRRCVAFGRIMLEEERNAVSMQETSVGAEEYTLRYPLTREQKRAAAECLRHIEKTDCLIQAVCGAGKTEIVIPAISEALAHGKKVCFAIARRQVVLEVAERLAGYFTHAKVIAVCGGHTSETDGDLIVATTHQLFRYTGAFDLLVLDEPDAFPYRGNDVLHGIARSACRGNIIYLTATPDETLMKRVASHDLHLIRLDQRPHGKPVPVPRIRIGNALFLHILLIRWIMEHEEHPRMIFVPTIAEAGRLQKFLRLLFSCEVCTSKEEDRDEIIERFRHRGKGIIIATTVLERGVTVAHADVCVWHAEDTVFDEAGLVQMAGRAGRDFNDPTGDVLFLCGERSELAERCVKALEEANASCAV